MQPFYRFRPSLRIAAKCILPAILLQQPVSAQDLDMPRAALSRDRACELEVRGRNSAFLITTTGLVPGEKIEVSSDSEGEIIRYVAEANGNGSYSFVHIPLVKGRNSGIARIAINASRCRLKASFPWRE